MTKDEERLLDEYRAIKQHRKGKLEVNVTERSGKYVSVSIICGRGFEFLIDNQIEVD